MVEMLGRVQREGKAVYLLVTRLMDLSAKLAGVGVRDAAFPLPHGRGGEFHHGLPDVDPRSDAIRVAPWDFR